MWRRNSRFSVIRNFGSHVKRRLNMTIHHYKQIIAESVTREQLKQCYEYTSVKVLLPQIFAVSTIVSFAFIVGIGLAFSGILIPDIEGPDGEIHALPSTCSWIAASTSLAMGIGSLFCGFIIDRLGRIRAVQFSSVLVAISWILIAVSRDVTSLIIGRSISGFGFSFMISTSGPYICEITWPQYRAAFLTTTTFASSLGVAFLYFGALIFDWRKIAWICFSVTVLLLILTFFIEESPIWYISKRERGKALKSFQWFFKFQNKIFGKNAADIQMKFWEGEYSEGNIIENNYFPQNLLKKSVYKPLSIILILSVIQQFSGIYVITAYEVTIFQKIGSKISPIVSANIVTGLPVFVSLANFFLAKKIRRKIILICSCLGIAVSLFVSGYFSKLINDGATGLNWIPVVCIFIFMTVSIVGLESIPWALMSELIPQGDKGTFMGISCSFAQFMMFASIYSFRIFEELMGIAGVQYFYGTVALFGIIFIHYFVPETHSKTLTELYEFYKN